MKIVPLVMTRTYSRPSDQPISNQQTKIGFGNGLNKQSVEPLSKQSQELLKRLIAIIPKTENNENASLRPFNRYLMTDKEIKKRYPKIEAKGSQVKKGPSLSVGDIHFYDGNKGFFDYGIMAKSDDGIEQIYVKDNQVFTCTPMQNLNNKFTEYANIILWDK